MRVQCFWRILILFACKGSSAKEKCVTDSDGEIRRHFYVGEFDLPLRLEVSNRTSHRLVSTIAKILLNEALGYPYIILHEQDADKRDDINRTLQMITTCENPGKCSPVDVYGPEVMVNLEVWLPPHFKMDDWVATGEVEVLGPLGPIGRSGWYIASYIVDYFWKTTDTVVDHWRFFSHPEFASWFDLSNKTLGDFKIPSHCPSKECDEYGVYRPKQCRNGQTCATLLADYPDSTFELLKNTINRLKLFVKIQWVGDQLNAIVEKHTCSQTGKCDKPAEFWRIVFFHRKPTSLSYINQFVHVTFPSCEDDLSSKCSYEINKLEKVVWSKIRTHAHHAFYLFKSIYFSQEDFINLLSNYMLSKSRSYSLEDIACRWVRENMITWDKWIPEDNKSKTKIYIGGIFPSTGRYSRESSVEEAAEMAAQAVNLDYSILSNYSLTILAQDGHCKVEEVMKSFYSYVTNSTYSTMVGILGPSCTETVESVVGVAKNFNVLIISYSAEGALSNTSHFFRTIPENTQFRYVYLEMLNMLGYSRVAALTDEGQKNTEYLSLLETSMQLKEMTFINRKLPKDRPNDEIISIYLKELKKLGANIIIVDVFDYAARYLMCAAYRLGMTAANGYLWFLPTWFITNWYDTDQYNTVASVEAVNCTTAQMIEALNGHISLSYNYYADENSIMQEGKTVKEWLNEYERSSKKHNKEISRYGGYAYDAVWVYAKALDKLFKENNSYIATLHTPKASRRLTELITETNFSGVSGCLSFLGSSRKSDVIISQWINNKTQRIGVYHSTTPGKTGLDLNESDIIWLTPDGKKPADIFSTLEENICAIEGFRRLFGDISCNTSIVIMNVIAISLFIAAILSGFILYKRQYDRKMKVREKRWKELGLMNAGEFALDEWEMPRDQIVINRKLGEGAFGTVYGGEALVKDQGWIAIAVKTLKNGAKPDEKLDFLSEAEIMKQFDHVNIVKLVGVCTRGEPVYTVMEFMLYGDLKTYLLSRRSIAASEKDRMHNDEVSDKRLTNMALDIARGLSYLADKKYVHRDLACRNCLVNISRSVKIADFGMCRAMFDSDYYRYNKKGMLPVRWMAPESLVDGLFTPMSDVWSYGVVLYELVTFASVPYQGLSNNQVLEAIKNHKILHIPKGSKQELCLLFMRCWSRVPQDRPQAVEIVEILAHNLELISPCLDAPVTSIQLMDTGTLEIPPHDRARVHSISSAWQGRRNDQNDVRSAEALNPQENRAAGNKWSKTEKQKSLHESFHKKTKRNHKDKPPNLPQSTYL